MTQTTETTQSIIVKSGYSRDNTSYQFTPFTLENWKTGTDTMAIDRNGNARRVKITSIKTWKTRPEILIKWKYGLYEYGQTLITASGQQGAILGNAVRMPAPATNASETGQAGLLFLILIVAAMVMLYMAGSAAARLAGYTDILAMLDALTSFMP